MSQQAPRRTSERPESSAIHTLQTTALLELFGGWAIVFVAGLLTLHDAFDLFTDILEKTANWYIAATFNLVWLAIGILILARRLRLRSALLGILTLFLFCGINELILLTQEEAPVSSSPTPEIPALEGELPGLPGAAGLLALGDERFGWIFDDIDRLADRGVHVRFRARPRWSTIDQVEYLQSLDEEIDLAVIAWSQDDPDVDGVRYVELSWQDGRRFAVAHLLFPRTWSFWTDRLNRLLENHVLSGYGVRNWSRRLYDSDNLRAYGEVVRRLGDLQEKHAIAIVVLPVDENADPRIDRALGLIDDAGLEVFDLRRRAASALEPWLAEKLRRERIEP